MYPYSSCLVFWFIFVLICVNCISFDFIFPAVLWVVFSGGLSEGYLRNSNKGMPRTSFGLDGILVALEIVIQLVLVMVVMVVAAAAVVLFRFVVVLLDRHRNGQWDLLNDRLRVYMRVMLHWHVYSNSAQRKKGFLLKGILIMVKIQVGANLMVIWTIFIYNLSKKLLSLIFKALSKSIVFK